MRGWIRESTYRLGPFTIDVGDDIGDDVEPNTPYPVTPTVTVDKAGVYELRLKARDHENDANDTVQITVWDPRPNDPNLVIYYDFNEGAGTTVLDHGEGIWEPNTTNFGYDGLYHYPLTTTGTKDPNRGNGPTGSTLVGTHDFGGAMFFDPDFHQAAIHDHSIINPDDDYLDGFTELTVMMWIKSSEIGTDRGFIIFDDPSGNDRSNMRYDASGNSSGEDDVIKIGVSSDSDRQEMESSANVQTTEWQHVALTWKVGETLKLYVNGVEDTNLVGNDPINSPLGRYEKIIVGRGGKDETDGTGDVGPNYGWHGWVDEGKIFQRALTSAQILQEAHIDNSPPIVDAGNSYLTWLDDLPLTTLAGTVGDGPPGDVADVDVVWSITDQPGGSNPSVTKTSIDWANPTAEFTTDTTGTYEITLTVTDSTGLVGSDTLEIPVVADACEAAQQVPGWVDFNPYDSDQNCVIDLIDYQAFAAQWLEDLRLTAPVAY